MRMDEFEYLESCCEKWSGLPPEKRTREQQVVLDVYEAVAAIDGDGLSGWWEGMIRHGNEEAFARVVQSFRKAGLERFAVMLEQTSFSQGVVAKTLESGASEYAFTPEQEKALSEVERFFSKNGPDANEALLKFLPPRK